MTKMQKATSWFFLWGARLGLAVLAFAGVYHLLGGVDPFISVPVSVAFVALLVRETL